MRDLRVVLTPFAKKYGVPSEAFDVNKLFRNHGKSGLTPTEASTILTLYEDDKHNKMIDKFQESKFGLTTRDLRGLGAFPYPGANPSSLENQIHPIFHYQNWEILGNIRPEKVLLRMDLSDECYSNQDPNIINSGLWSASNPALWGILLPILRLVSRFLDEIHTFVWFDAFLNGTFTQLPDNLDPRNAEERSLDPPLWRFYQRVPKDIFEVTKFRSETSTSMTDVLSTRFRFGISSTHVYPYDNKTPNDRLNYGSTINCSDIHGYILISLTLESIVPLFRTDLNTSERFCHQFLIARTLLHELAHATNFALATSQPWYGMSREPFFENQIFSELGTSLETSLFDGTMIPIMFDIRNHLTLPRLGNFGESFPSYFGKGGGPYIGGDAALPRERYLTPIISNYYEWLQNEDFWKCGLAKWGTGALRPYQDQPCRIMLREEDGGSLQKDLAVHPDDDLFWKRDAEEIVNFRDRLKNLLEHQPAEKKRYLISEELANQSKERTRHLTYQIKRKALAENIIEKRADIEDAWYNHDTDRIVEKQQDLVQLLEDECVAQSREIVKLSSGTGSHRPEFLSHRKYLSRLNRHLREIVSNLKDDALGTNDHYTRRRLDELTSILHTCSLILSGERGNVGLPGSSAVIEALLVSSATNARNHLITAEQTETVKANDILDNEEEIWEIENLIKKAEETISKGDQEGCKDIGTSLLGVIGSKPQVRAVAMILLSNVRGERRAEYYAEKGSELLDMTRGDAIDIEDENTLKFWLDISKRIQTRIRNEFLLGTLPNCWGSDMLNPAG